jgi:outer membrane protein assembly factor BamD
MVMKRPVPEADPVAVSRMKYELENRTKQGPLSHILGGFSGHPNMAPAAKSGTPPMEGFRPTIPSSVPVTAANPNLGGDVTISQPGGDAKAVENAPDVRPNGGAGTAPGTAAAPAADATSTASKAPDPNAVVQQANMTPAQQKKAFAEAVKQQQAAARKASNERRKREAQQAQLVKEQKKKSKQQQLDQQKSDQQKQDKPQTPPTPTGQGGAAPPKQ